MRRTSIELSAQKALPPTAFMLARKQIAPMMLCGLIAWLLWDHARALDMSAILTHVTTVPARTWGFAVLCTGLSYWAIGRYDRLLHGHLDSGIDPKIAERSGIAAIGLSQTTGFGALIGALVRWRMIPEFDLIAALRMTLFVALSFLAGLAVITALTILLIGSPISGLTPIAIGILITASGFCALSLYPPAALAHWNWPSLKMQGAVLGFVALDTLSAAAAFYVLLPSDIALSFANTVLAYLCALGAGLLGATPGGVGPFEATLSMLLPAQPLAPLLGAVLAFRIVYYLLPAGLAVLLLIRRPNPSAQPIRLTAPTEELCQTRAQFGLLRAGHLHVLTQRGRPQAICTASGQSLLIFGAPLTDGEQELQYAKRRLKMPVYYKLEEGFASELSRTGWRTLALSDEALLNPQSFSTQGPRKRQLRRFLRKAESLNITRASPDLPFNDMARVARVWAERNGGERGFSCGVYDPAYLSHQKVFLAYHGDELVAFVSFHHGADEWVLDLIRHTDDAPTGTIHALVTHAIENAKAEGITRLSLDTAPRDMLETGPILQQLWRLGTRRAQGLRRFKACFDPEWAPRHIATKGPLLLAGLDIARQITAPRRR